MLNNKTLALILGFLSISIIALVILTIHGNDTSILINFVASQLTVILGTGFIVHQQGKTRDDVKVVQKAVNGELRAFITEQVNKAASGKGEAA